MTEAEAPMRGRLAEWRAVFQKLEKKASSAAPLRRLVG